MASFVELMRAVLARRADPGDLLSAIGGTADHGSLDGLADDDHAQYHNDARGDLRYAPIAKGVTNGDAHDHNGGDGAQIAYSNLSGLPDLSSLHARSHAVTSTSDHTAGNWKVFFSNGSGEIVELALASSGFLQSNGASSAPSWSAPESAIADAVGGDEVTKINAILAALRAKNIIST